MEAILQMQLYGMCLAVLAIMWLSGDRCRTASRDVDTRLFRAMLLSTALMISTNALSILANGRPGPGPRAILIAANCLYYFFHAFPLPLAILYADYQLFRDPRRLARYIRALLAVVAGIAVLAFLSPWLGLAFRIDAQNRYLRGYWFMPFAASQFLLSLYLVCHIVRNRKKVNRRVFLVLAAYPVPMILAAAIQTAFYGITLLWPMMTLFLVTVAFNLENRRSKTDYLTGVANRRSLDEELEQRIDANRSGRFLYGLLIDIDAFKTINDRFGHEAGDRALEDLSNVLQSAVRVEDFVARLGGDEFVVLADSAEPMDIEGFVRRIDQSVAGLNEDGRRPYRICLSIGRCARDKDAPGGGREYLAALDADMYRRKQQKAER
jgi:diguanylate cyclase (GGDEF)-like protein